jgi:Ca2+-binding EF-hand superfamily protein
MDDEKWREILDEVDKDKDGKISFQEFNGAIEKFINKIY